MINQQREPIPLDNEECSSGSIYLLRMDGSLWTWRRTADGCEPYKQVRPPSKTLPREIYVCVCCSEQWDEMPAKHPIEILENSKEISNDKAS